MKRVLIGLLALLMLFSTVFPIGAFAEESPLVAIEVRSSSNLLFNRYDVDIYIDGVHHGTISNGETYSTSTHLSNGRHTISFYKSGNKEVTGLVDISIDGDTHFTCTISSGASKITVSDQKTVSEGNSALNGNSSEVIPESNSTLAQTEITGSTMSGEGLNGQDDNADASDNLVQALITSDTAPNGETIERSTSAGDDPILSFAGTLEGIDGLTYSRGNRGDTVSSLQTLLSNLDYLESSDVDGKYGKHTAEAITAFQQAEGLEETGEADLSTQFLLIARSPKREITQKTNTVIISSDQNAIIIWMDGSLFVGTIKAGDQLDEGTYIYLSGDYYAGSFQKGKRSGMGTAHFANGDVYEGNWANDMMNGIGKYYFGGICSAETYEGNWVDNRMEGKGTYTLANGQIITGTWKNNKHISW